MEASRRVSRDGEENIHDDDRDFLKEEAGTFVLLEVVHIIPYLLITV